MYAPLDIHDQIGFLCIDHRSKGKITKVPVGSCFFVCVHNHERNCIFAYLVTAKHVWGTFKDKRLSYVRLNKVKAIAGETGVAYIQLPKTGWIFHSDPAVDLAVLPWAASTGSANYKFVYSEFNEIAKTEETMKKEGFFWPPKQGEDIVHAGLLLNYHGREQNFCVVRRGHVALVTSELINSWYGPANYHLIDLQAYPGHSGGPVWVLYPTKQTGVTMFLLGVLVGAYPELQETLQIQRAGLKKIEYYSLGISMVVPSSKIIEIINSPKMEEMRKRDEPRPKSGVPLTR